MAGKNFTTRNLIRDLVLSSLSKNGEPSQGIFALAIYVCFSIAKHFNGERMYIPSGAAQKNNDADQKRFSQIFDEFDGRNSRALARKYNLSQRTIQRTIVVERQRRKAMRDAASKASV